MDWLFIAFLAASLFHMGEEYFYPGGFMDVMKRLNPKFAPSVTVRMAVVINGMQLLLCILVVLIGRTVPLLGMSVAALLLFNGVTHLAACVRTGRYVPGVATGTVFYIPVSVHAFHVFMSAGRVSIPHILAAAALGLVYQAVPIAYLGIASALRKAR